MHLSRKDVSDQHGVGVHVPLGMLDHRHHLLALGWRLGVSIGRVLFKRGKAWARFGCVQVQVSVRARLGLGSVCVRATSLQEP